MPVTIDNTNLTFGSSGARIRGDFSIVTPRSNRTIFQTSTPNGNTGIRAMPSGAGTNASFGVYNTSDPENCSFASLNIDAGSFEILSNHNGSGVDLPVLITVGSTQCAKFEATGTTIPSTLIVSGESARFKADFSNATLSKRFMFQTSTTNANSNVRVMPNGSGNQSTFGALNGSDPANANVASFGIDEIGAFINSDSLGSATDLGFRFTLNATGVLAIDTSQNLILGTQLSSPGSKVFLIENATSVPSTNPTGGGIIYVEGGALKYRGSSGTVTTIAAA